MDNKQADKGIYINGKQQAIDLLKLLTKEEKERILAGIRARNPQMARELSENSFSFQNLAKLNPDSLSKVFNQFQPAVIALSIRFVDERFQRHVLRSIDRSKAEETYHIMQRISLQKRSAGDKAQRKVLQTAVNLARQNLITIQ